MQTHTRETAGTSAEQEVVGISRKYHKMVAKAIFFNPPSSHSFFMELDNKMRTNQRCSYRVVVFFFPPSFPNFSPASFLWFRLNTLTKCVVAFPKENH